MINGAPVGGGLIFGIDSYGDLEWGEGMQAWGECPGCGNLGIGHLGFFCCSGAGALQSTATARLSSAYDAARSARFEYGETPNVRH